MNGWKLVPVEPTTEMVEALKARITTTSRGGLLGAGAALAEAIAAAPVPPAEQDRESKVNELVEFMDHLSGGMRHFAGAIIDAGWAKASPVQPAGGEPGAVEGLRQLVIGPYPDPDVEDAHDEYLDEHQSQALWLLRNAGRIEAHVTRLQAENAGCQKSLGELWKQIDAYRKSLEKMEAERDALKAEVSFLMRRATEIKADRDALQSALAAAKKLLEADRADAERWRFFSVLANDLQAFPHSWGKMTPEKMNYMCDEAMNSANQSAPAACWTPASYECPGDGVGTCKKCPNAPAAKGGA